MTRPVTALTEARAALAAFDAPRCRRGMVYSAAGQTLCSLPAGHRGPHRAVYYEPSVDHLRAALARVDELEAEANGGYRVLLRDCDDLIATALRAVEIGAFPGPSWRERAAAMRGMIREVCDG